MPNDLLIGYSRKIDDPAFKKYLKHEGQWAIGFSVVIAIIAIVGFTVAGEMGIEDMENPESMMIGFGIGSMFLIIALIQVFSKKGTKTWDGVVFEKKAIKKRKKRTSGDDTYYEDVMIYSVIIKKDSGGEHEISTENDDTLYRYYKEGDRVRRHGGLKSFEKYDKSNDDIIFCAACATLCDINEEMCPRCHCPILK